jgi:hypothetical protein
MSLGEDGGMGMMGGGVADELYDYGDHNMRDEVSDTIIVKLKSEKEREREREREIESARVSAPV